MPSSGQACRRRRLASSPLNTDNEEGVVTRDSPSVVRVHHHKIVASDDNRPIANQPINQPTNPNPAEHDGWAWAATVLAVCLGHPCEGDPGGPRALAKVPL